MSRHRWRFGGRGRVALVAAGVVAVVSVAVAVGAGPRGLPPAKQAALDQEAADQAKGLANPALKNSAQVIPLGPQAPTPQFPGVQTVNAGAGVIIESSAAPPGEKNAVWINLWQEQGDSYAVGVYAGGVADDPTQGLVVWVRSGPAPEFSDVVSREILTPRRAGPVNVVAANGEVLTLLAADGTTFTFDASTGVFQ
jgi:hypothetical protein